MLFGIRIYALSAKTVILIIFLLGFIWGVLQHLLNRKLWKFINVAAVLCSLYGVLLYSAIGRQPSVEHVIAFFAPSGNEFFRELLMNVFLYFPLGLSLTVLIGPWAILAGFALSLGIECWQYFAGTGLAQGTDVLCNTLGCAIGAIPWLVNRWIDKRRGRLGKDEQGLSNQQGKDRPGLPTQNTGSAGASTAAKSDDPNTTAKPEGKD